MVEVRKYMRANRGKSGPQRRRANKSLPRNITQYVMRGKTYLQLQICRHGESLKISLPSTIYALNDLIKQRDKFVNKFKNRITISTVNSFQRKSKPKRKYANR